MKAAAVICSHCGQRGDRPPGLKLDDFHGLDAVFVGDEAVPTPQRLTCRSCHHVWAIARDSVEIRDE